MGYNLLILSFLLIYFWYFYFDFDSKPLQKPNTLTPAPPTKSNLKFEASTHSMFKLIVNNVEVMKHSFPPDLATYWVHKVDQKIIERDDCQPYPASIHIPAKKFSLYKYLKANPNNLLLTDFEKNSPYTAFEKDVFYFECKNRHISLLKMCESGKIFQNHHCVDVTACTGRPDGTSIPYLGDVTKFIVCSNGREFVRYCPSDHFFYHTKCVPKTDLPHYCQFHPDTPAPFKLDQYTLFECRDHKPILTRCEPGTRIFEGGTACEPEDCVGRPDGARVPMKERRVGPFVFWPGYVECFGGRVVDPPVECPQSWDPFLTKGDDTTSLPMVFDGTQCAVPTFCENVWSDDPETIVPAHDFTKHVRNWKYAGIYDAASGYVCEGVGRGAKRKLVTFEGETRIDAKRFRRATACNDPSRHYLPILDKPEEYYDCIQGRVVTCPVNQHFDGDACRNYPIDLPVFKHRNLPLFNFDSLNSEGWISAWDYVSPTPKGLVCGGNHEYLRMYNICIHTECKKYAFLSMVPELSVLLPHGRNAKCVFDENKRTLSLEDVPSVSGKYTFWDQKLWPSRKMDRGDGSCAVGQTLQTGHFIFDKTVYATCDYEQPFVFCPSPHTKGIEKIDEHLYACVPPPGNEIFHARTTEQYGQNTYTPFVVNEVKGIKPGIWDGIMKYEFKLWKKDPVTHDLPQHGFQVPIDSKFNFKVNHPVWLELRYRVTFPPNVAFKYDEATNERKAIWDNDSGKGFHVRHQAFENWSLKFPRYRSQTHVFNFMDSYIH